MSDLAFREHTWDRNIWDSIVRENEYHLKAVFHADDVVLDIGAHIGAFAYAVLDRGAGHVVCVEPDADNFLFLRHNLHAACKATDRAICISAACWRSDGFHPHVHYAPVGANTGGGNCLGDNGIPTAALPLDVLASLAASVTPQRRIRLVKLDCEGSEWPILYTAHVYHLVDAFVGEYHTLDESMASGLHLHRKTNIEALAEFFKHLGYNFASYPSTNGLGLFHAWKQGKEVW